MYKEIGGGAAAMEKKLLAREDRIGTNFWFPLRPITVK
jgi:hypothetical protein